VPVPFEKMEKMEKMKQKGKERTKKGKHRQRLSTKTMKMFVKKKPH
jgi:hypothetical protein